jgi:hypothetical protein
MSRDGIFLSRSIHACRQALGSPRRAQARASIGSTALSAPPPPRCAQAEYRCSVTPDDRSAARRAELGAGRLYNAVAHGGLAFLET